MTDDDGNLVTKTVDILKHFQGYFERILDDKHGVNISDKHQRIIFNTVKIVLEAWFWQNQDPPKLSKNNKIAGENTINTELLKLVGTPLVTQIQQLGN